MWPCWPSIKKSISFTIIPLREYIATPRIPDRPRLLVLGSKFRRHLLWLLDLRVRVRVRAHVRALFRYLAFHGCLLTL